MPPSTPPPPLPICPVCLVPPLFLPCCHLPDGCHQIKTALLNPPPPPNPHLPLPFVTPPPPSSTLQAGPIEVDEALLRRLHAKAVAAAQQEARESEGALLDADDIAAYKRRVADLLQPGETVLAALRRLGGW